MQRHAAVVLLLKRYLGDEHKNTLPFLRAYSDFSVLRKQNEFPEGKFKKNCAWKRAEDEPSGDGRSLFPFAKNVLVKRGHFS